MKKYLCMLTLALSLFLSPLNVFAGGDCTEWLGTWTLRELDYKGSVGDIIYYWEVTRADKYCAMGKYYTSDPSETRDLLINWSEEIGCYFGSYDISVSTGMKMFLIGDFFWCYHRYDDRPHKYEGTKTDASIAGSVLIEDNFDLTITDAGIEGYKLDCLLKFSADSNSSDEVFWYIDPESIKLK